MSSAQPPLVLSGDVPSIFFPPFPFPVANTRAFIRIKLRLRLSLLPRRRELDAGLLQAADLRPGLLELLLPEPQHRTELLRAAKLQEQRRTRKSSELVQGQGLLLYASEDLLMLMLQGTAEEEREEPFAAARRSRASGPRPRPLRRPRLQERFLQLPRLLPGVQLPLVPLLPPPRGPWKFPSQPSRALPEPAGRDDRGEAGDGRGSDCVTSLPVYQQGAGIDSAFPTHLLAERLERGVEERGAELNRGHPGGVVQHDALSQGVVEVGFPVAQGERRELSETVLLCSAPRSQGGGGIGHLAACAACRCCLLADVQGDAAVLGGFGLAFASRSAKICWTRPEEEAGEGHTSLAGASGNVDEASANAANLSSWKRSTGGTYTGNG